MPRHVCWILGLVLLLVSAHAAQAEDAYFRVSPTELTITDGELPVAGANRWLGLWADQPARVVLDGPGEAYLFDTSLRPMPDQRAVGTGVAVKAPAGGDVSGMLVLPGGRTDPGMTRVRFTIPANKADPDAAPFFHNAKAQHFERLARGNAAGAAWFRHQARDARRFLADRAQAPGNVMMGAPPQDLSSTLDLFSGGLAISENLQLDRLLADRPELTVATVDMASIEGITVEEIDWTPYLASAHPTPDPLAGAIPIDQHAIFIPSVDALERTLNELDQYGNPLVRAFDLGPQPSRTVEFYRIQLAMPSGTLAEVADSISSIAITGSDASLPTGSDLAVLLETSDPAGLRKHLMTRRGNAPTPPGEDGQAAGIAYTRIQAPDRRICSYLAELRPGVIVVTNSPAQLQRLAEVQSGQIKPLAEAPEYSFFRDRYRRDDGHEAALLVLSDATIRRWCGPRWRIGDSRRMRAAALLGEMQSQYADAIVTNTVAPGPIHTDLALPDIGTLQLTPAGTMSSVYGSLEFMTPIIELDLDRATQAEADAYQQWQRGYQSNWRQAFDPIAIRFDSTPQRMSADVTVMPLIAGSDYNEFISICRGATIGPRAGDPHGALLHMIMAVNKDSEPVRNFSTMLTSFLPGARLEVLSWVGSSVGIYADDGPIWAELAQRDPAAFPLDFLPRLPIGLNVEVAHRLPLAAFLTAVRAYVEQSAPGATTWENMDHNGQVYVRVRQNGRVQADNLAVYYAILPESLLVTLNQDVIFAALDRQADRDAGADAATAPATQPTTQPAAPAAGPWLGEHLNLRVDGRMAPLLARLVGLDPQRQMRRQAWSALPILNEWKRLYPDRDPVAVHEAVFGITLAGPMGEAYQWNDQWRTMESTLYGHPGDPRTGPAISSLMQNLLHADFGVTFEEQGLRGRAEITRSSDAGDAGRDQP